MESYVMTTEFKIVAISIIAVILLCQFSYKWYKQSKVPKPHKHTWKLKFGVGSIWDREEFHTCTVCGAEGWEKNANGIKVIKRGDPKYNEPHVHDWHFEYRGGRPAGAPDTTPMSHVFSCECGLFAVQHFDKPNTELTIIKS